MTIQVVSAEEGDPERVQRMCRSILAGLDKYSLLSFKAVGEQRYNTVSLLEQPIETDDLSIAYVLEVESIYVFTISEFEVVKGWLFVFPREGKVFTLNNGIFYMKVGFDTIRRSSQKLVEEVENSDLRKINTEIIFSQNMFSILKSPNESLLFVVRDATYVMTQ